MEDSELLDLLGEPVDGGEAVLARLVLTIVACAFAHRFLWALLHGPSRTDEGTRCAAAGISAIVTVVLSAIVTCWSDLVSGRFLAVVYSGDLPTYVVSLAPSLLLNLAFVLGGGAVLGLVRRVFGSSC